MRTILKVFFVFLCICILVGKTALANDSVGEEKRDKWEIGVAIGFAAPHLDTSYDHTYSPGFLYGGTEVITSTATQVLNITDKNSMGLSMVLNRFITGKIGIQLAAEFHKTPLRGMNNSYDTYLQYINYPPPEYKAKTLTRKDHMDWPPETDGSLKQITVGLNLLTRFNPGRAVTVDLSVGPSLFQFSGEVYQIGFTRYSFLHYGLVSHLFRLSASIKSTIKLGLNIGGEVNISLLRDLALFVSCRYYFCPNVSSEIRLKEMLNTNGGYSPIPIDVFESKMNLQPLKIDPSFLSLSAGLKLTL